MKRLLENKDRVSITFGKHNNNLTGYWALVGKKHGMWQETGHGMWQETGHGDTLEDAIEEAISIYLGHQTRTIWESERFSSFIDQVEKVAGDSYQDELPTEYKAVFEAKFMERPPLDVIFTFLDINMYLNDIVSADEMSGHYYIWVFKL
jgi:hypothetical protein